MFIKSKNSKTKILIKVWRKIGPDWKIRIYTEVLELPIWKERWHCIWFIVGLNKLIRIYTHFNYLYMYQNIFSNLLIKEKIKSLGISLSNFQYITFIFANDSSICKVHNIHFNLVRTYADCKLQAPILKEYFLLNLVIVLYRIRFS